MYVNLEFFALLSAVKIILSILLFPFLVHAYPDFISYGYRTCVTCHYNGQGGGSLNDYGRAVWASEITSHALTGTATADELGESSGFLGSTELPWYVRPGFKYRGLYLRSEFGSSKAVDRWIHMQADANVAIHFDKRYEKVLVASYGYTPTSQRLKSSNEPKPSNWLSHEYYFRWQTTKKQYLYVGFMDKFYGIKHPDHTAFNRALIRNSQYDQTHGLAYQYLAENYDLTGHVFMGNLGQTKDLRQAGAATLFEYGISKSLAVGTTAMILANDYSEQKNIGATSRVAFAKGKSFIAEIGLKDDKNKSTSKSVLGYYGFMQGVINISQGYNFLTALQLYQTELNSTSPLENRMSLGGIFFPYPKTEFRFEFVNSRTTTEENTAPDKWSLLAQVHLAL